MRTTEARQDHPRLLLIDHTAVGDGSATGELKAALFKEWPPARLMQIYQRSAHFLGLRSGATDRRFVATKHGMPPPGLVQQIKKFDPQLILYRMAALPSLVDLHSVAMEVISSIETPLAVWIMDDWPAAIEKSASPLYSTFGGDWRSLVRLADWRLSIGEMMSCALGERYGVPFEPFANGVDPAEWPETTRKNSVAVTLRYAGSLAENMTLDSVVRIAEAIERVAGNGVPIAFEINTRPFWREKAASRFAAFKHTRFTEGDLTRDAYRAWLSSADIGVVAYNFDKLSTDYVRYSVANKLPECLASGAALLAHGPEAVATIAFLKATGSGALATEPDVARLAEIIRDLATSPERRKAIGDSGRRLALEKLDVRETRNRFLRGALKAANSKTHLPRGIPRMRSAHVDETRVVARLLSDRPKGSIMIDVGAHQGSALAPFHEMGWKIFAFEPDPSNREKLAARFGAAPKVTIDPRAVGETAATGIPFFTSEESSGISGLHAFRDTHVKTGAVDVTTLSEIVADHAIAHVDFLKIDVEGHDFSVLKGAPLEELQPDVIECEFEDAKTVPIGHSYAEIAAFLNARGYAVYISEWHPVVRYGIRHQWRRVVAHPANIAADAWGNFLAFREDPGLESVTAAFEAELETDARVYHAARKDAHMIALHAEKTGADPGSVALAFADIKRTGDMLPPRSFYVRAAERLHEASPQLYAILRAGKRLMTRR